MAKKDKHKFNTAKKTIMKTHVEKDGYNRFISKSTISPEATVETFSNALQGSNEIYSENDNLRSPNTLPVPTPFHVKIGDWFKGHSVEILVIVIVLGVLGWLCVSVINLSMDMRENKTRIELIKEDIEDISDGMISKEILELELESIEKDISNLTIFSIGEVERRLDSIEEQLSEIHN